MKAFCAECYPKFLKVSKLNSMKLFTNQILQLHICNNCFDPIIQPAIHLIKLCGTF